MTSVEQNTENMKTGVIMTPVFMFSVFCSTDGTSFHVFGTLLH
jgi:hypothetical protein